MSFLSLSLPHNSLTNLHFSCVSIDIHEMRFTSHMYDINDYLGDCRHGKQCKLYLYIIDIYMNINIYIYMYMCINM